MRHYNGLQKLGRSSPHRRSLLNNLALALFGKEQIETTLAKAKALRSFAEKLLSLAKRGDLHARRLVARHIKDQDILQKLFGDLALRYKDRQGGYTRVLKLSPRRGDNSDMALVELVDKK